VGGSELTAVAEEEADEPNLTKLQQLVKQWKINKKKQEKLDRLR
jgi:hypothetical protein